MKKEYDAAEALLKKALDVKGDSVEALHFMASECVPCVFVFLWAGWGRLCLLASSEEGGVQGVGRELFGGVVVVGCVVVEE